MTMKKKQDLAEFLQRGIVDQIADYDLIKFLSISPRRIKFGIDPTNPKIHLGRVATLFKIRTLQDLGHKLILIIGDYTALIGDASDKTDKRPQLTTKQIKNNLKNYLDQIGTVINLEEAEVHYNSSWLQSLGLLDILDLAQQFTVAQMIERDNFSQRLAQRLPISLHELLYPMIQGYDSVAIRADLEVGGTDQLFNLHAGRTLQRFYSLPPQAILTFELLYGTDGRKMSSTWGNCIYLTDDFKECFAKLMTLSDEQIKSYLINLSNYSLSEINKMLESIQTQNTNPRDIKMKMAHNITARIHGIENADHAQELWVKQFSQKQLPENIPTIKLVNFAVMDSLGMVNFLSDNFKLSRSEIKRLIEQNGVKLNGKVINNTKSYKPVLGDIWQVGKRKFLEISQ